MTVAIETKVPKVWEAGGVHIKSWAPEAEAGAIEQIENLSRLPFAHHHVALMPDAHQGYGMPIGGVLFADRVVVPYAIGVDIGCGVILVRTDLIAEEFVASRQEALAQILRDVPVGNGPHGEHDAAQMDANALMDNVPVLTWGVAQRVARQLGTLGGGNHFIELQVDKDDRVYIMLHSGSRALGKTICDHFARAALELNKMWFSELPDKELAYLPMEAPEAQAYWSAMNFALGWAETNRYRMVVAVESAIRRRVRNDVIFEPIVDTHHNYATWENHFGKNGIVHRKGAVRAREGEDVLIPGSMGTFSYWARGKGNPESFQTCQHGAGRKMSRGAARKMFTVAEVTEQMDAIGTTLLAHDPDSVIDEAPGAYKDVASVMENSRDLVEIVQELRPLGTVKG